MDQLLEMILGGKNKGNLTDIMEKFGLNESKAKEAIGSLLPGVTRGINQQAQKNNTSILDQIASAQQENYLDDDNAKLYDDDAVAGGNSILEQILGGKKESRELASQASQSVGIDSSILKKLLPMVASMAMGSLGKQAKSRNVQSSNGGIVDMVTSMLDKDGDGFGLSDIMSLAGKFFK